MGEGRGKRGGECQPGSYMIGMIHKILYYIVLLYDWVKNNAILCFNEAREMLRRYCIFWLLSLGHT